MQRPMRTAKVHLTALERDVFLRAARTSTAEVLTACETVGYAGCRISEAPVLNRNRVDFAAETSDRGENQLTIVPMGSTRVLLHTVVLQAVNRSQMSLEIHALMQGRER